MGRVLAIVALAAMETVSAPAQAQTTTADDVASAKITAIAARSSCASLKWERQGRAPAGFIQGMALVFARSVCRADRPEIRLVSAARADKTDARNDALNAYEPAFQKARMPNSGEGLAILRHTYVLLIGLGMRESTGRYCVGRDKAGTKTDAKTVEAGLFQTTFGTSTAHTELPKLFARYEKDRAQCFRDVFGRGVTCDAQDTKNWGDGDGARFQDLTKTCPAFATEYAAIVMRTVGGARGEFGPLRGRTVALRAECDSMLSEIQSLVHSDANLCTAFNQ